MAKSIIAEGKTTAEAIKNGLKELGLIKVLDEKKKSFFNILDPHVVKVEITEKEFNPVIREEKEIYVSEEDMDEELKRVENFLKQFLPKISDKITYKINKEDNIIKVEIEGDEASKLIGYRGETLNSLQLVISNIASKDLENSGRVVVDIIGYREKRKQTLEELAIKIEKTVKRTGKKITLEPMPPYERKIIHTKLQNSEFVKTYSIGENNKRRIVVSKK